MGTFKDRMQDLSDTVGTGKMTGSVVVDQAYAQFQHESLQLRHPNGGKAKFLYEPLVMNHGQYYQMVADSLLDAGGPKIGMAKAMDYLSAEVFLNAPVELGDLRRSGSPSVYDGQERVYHKPPIQRRLSAAELEAKEELRISLGLGLAGGDDR